MRRNPVFALTIKAKLRLHFLQLAFAHPLNPDPGNGAAPGTDAPIVTAPAALTMTSLSDALQRSLAAVTDAKAAKKLPDRAGKPVKAEATTKARRKSA